MPRMPDIAPISELRTRQRELLDQASNEPVVLTHRGKGVAVLVSIDRWNELMEEVEDLRDAADAAEARESADPTVSLNDYAAARDA